MSIRTLYEHRILKLLGFTVARADWSREYVRLSMPDWVNIVAITRGAEVVLVRQHRFGIDAPTLEIPGGCVDAGEDPAVAAERELREETGYAGGVWRSLGWVWSNPAIQDNRTFLFAVDGVERVGEPELGQGEEDLEVVLQPAASLPALLRDGVINHALAVVALQRVLLEGR